MSKTKEKLHEVNTMEYWRRRALDAERLLIRLHTSIRAALKEHDSTVIMKVKP